MLSDKNSQLADANLTLQMLTKQLTEATETQDELRATFLRSQNEICSYKKSLQFRLNLAQARIEKLTENNAAQSEMEALH